MAASGREIPSVISIELLRNIWTASCVLLMTWWLLITHSNRLFECNILSHLYYIVECATEFVFYCVPGSTTEWRMEQNLAMDYSTIYGRKESEKYGAKNILIPEALAKNRTQVAMPCSLCKCPIFCEIAGLHMSEIVQGKCPNKRCLNNTALPMQQQISYSGLPKEGFFF